MNFYEEHVAPVLANPQVAGMLGSLLSLRWVPGVAWLEKFFCFGCGVACAIYGSPALIEIMNLKSAWAPSLFSFLLGFLGMNILAKGMDIVKNTDWVAIFMAARGQK